MRRCGLSRWGDEPSTDDIVVHIESVPGEVFIFHGDELHGPSFDTVEDQVGFALRQICHLLVERLDTSGLGEACQSLAEFYEYYRPKEGVPAVQATSNAQNRLLPAQPEAIRRIMPSIEARPFRISED